MYKRFRNALTNLIRYQHRVLPLPLSVWKLIYRKKRFATVPIVRFYGQECFLADYLDTSRLDRGAQGNINYWLSKKSLYWHYWKAPYTDIGRIEDIGYTFPGIFSGNILELGFGIGRYFPEIMNFSSEMNYYALEPNKYCIEETKKAYPQIKCICSKANEIPDKFIENNNITKVFVFGGVLAFLSLEEMKDLFEEFKSCSLIIVLNEGGDEDIIREDNTIVHDIPSRVSEIWEKPVNKILKHKTKRINGIYDVLIFERDLIS